MRSNGRSLSRIVAHQVRVAGISLLVSSFVIASLGVSSAQSITWLGTLGGDWSTAVGVSADGSVVVGRAQDASNDYARAFRWTASGGMEDLNITYARLLGGSS